MNGSEHFGIPLRTASVVVPVALYFLVLGLLNSRKRPQVLTGRVDFALLILALSPLFLIPILNCVGPSPLALVISAAALIAAILILAPRGRTWVIYNIPAQDCADIVARALGRCGIESTPCPQGMLLPAHNATVRLSRFNFLRNVTVRLEGGSDQFAADFANAIAGGMGRVSAVTSPMAMGLLLVATGMLVAPLALVANHVPEMVRLITDLIK